MEASKTEPTTAVPKLFGRFCGRQFFQRPGVEAGCLRMNKHVTFKVTSCCAAWFITGPDWYRPAAWRSGTLIYKQRHWHTLVRKQLERIHVLQELMGY